MKRSSMNRSGVKRSSVKRSQCSDAKGCIKKSNIFKMHIATF